MNGCKVGKIVEYVKSCGDFCFDRDDLIEADIQDILAGYGIYSVLTPDEEDLLLLELLELAEKNEIAEAVRWASHELVCGQDQHWGSDFRIPDIRA